MPAHTYIRTGRYHDATLTNFAASTADKAFLAVCHGSNGIYPLGYVPHNWHFATMTAGLTGSRTLALEAAAQTAQRVDRGMMATPTAGVHAAVPGRAAVNPGAVRGMGRDPRAGRTAGGAAVPDRASGTSRAAWRRCARARWGAQDELDALRAIAADPALAKVSFLDINHADATARGGGAAAARRTAARAGPPQRRHRRAARGRCRGGRAQLQRTRRLAVAGAPLPGRRAARSRRRARGGSRLSRRTLRSIPDNGWSLYGLAQAQRKLGETAAAQDSARRHAARGNGRTCALIASRF